MRHQQYKESQDQFEMRLEQKMMKNASLLSQIQDRLLFGQTNNAQESLLAIFLAKISVFLLNLLGLESSLREPFLHHR